MPDDEPRLPSPLVQIKDLLGFSEPAKRLIDAIERGVGQLLEPWQSARMTRA
jgi:hypothetical protein